MKKSVIAIGIIAILGYVGSSWYTGNVIKNNIDKKIEQITQKIDNDQDGFSITIEYSDYRQSIFSTNLHLTVKVIPKNFSWLIEDTKTLFNDDITIHHGPFPIIALSEGKFTPQMAWIEYAMSEALSPELWQLAGNQPFITAKLGMSYQENLTIKLANKALNLVDSDSNNNSEILSFINGSLEVSDGDINIEVNKHLSDLHAQVNIDKFIYKNYKNFSKPQVTLQKFNLSAYPNSDKTGIHYNINADKIALGSHNHYIEPRITFDNLKYQGDTLHKTGVIIPNHHTEMGKMTLEFNTSSEPVPDDQKIIINNLMVDQENIFNPTNNTVDGLLKADAESVLLGLPNVGSVSLDLSYQNIPVTMLSNNFDYTDFDDKQTSLNSQISLNKFHFKNTIGEVNANAFVALSGIRSRLERFIININNIDSLKLNVDAPFNVLAYFSAQLKTPNEEALTPEQIEKENLSIKSSIAENNFIKIPLFTFEKNNIEGVYSEVDYAKDKQEATLNGQILPIQDFLQKVFGDN
ncbi:DUF945 family protein [Gilliamella sp. ESL0254]|uniref:DUF945 family protein n=1 Tax=Gilliamella sp. ESL0254 TaxID=2705035 RepID=UPI00157FF199|nr:DUF945 family protein [Gilliamella sp. ESL0254]NUF27158.1 YdgA family protein [Gilliamella sp. ESL0254]